jgi:plastocyanin
VKSRLSSLMVITVLLIVLCLPNAYSDFETGKKYLIQANGYIASSQSIVESTFALQLTAGSQSGTNLLANLDNGLITIGSTNFLNSGVWQTTILRNGNFLLLQGDAQDQSGNTIHLNLFGRIVTSNQDGSVYGITGKITGSETFKVIYSAKVTTAGETILAQPSGPTTPTSQNQTQPNVIRISIVPGASNINNQQYFSPSVANVRLGTTVVWINNDSVPHHILSGTASTIIGPSGAPTFTPDEMIDSGILIPGGSFQYTITSFPNRGFLSDAQAKYLNLDPHQTAGDISFFDPNYPFMQGAIGPISVSIAQAQAAQINILQGASTAKSNQYLSPANVQVTPGSTVVWVNNDSVSHRILSGQSQNARTVAGKGSTAGQLNNPYFVPDGRIDSKMIFPGQSYQFTVKGSGAIAFYDPVNTWLNGIIISTPQISPMPPVEVSILPGSSLAQGGASQSNQQYYNQYYSPTTIQITPGTAIIWKNNDNVAHTIWSGTATNTPSKPFIPDGRIKSDAIQPGASFEVVINDTGTTEFYDPSYTWMNGVIVAITSVASSHNIGVVCPTCNPFLH